MSKCTLTPDQAIAMLDPEADYIHTFRNPSIGLMLGADWDRAGLLDAIRKAVGLEIGGEQCQATNHGLVVWTDNRSPLFVECRNGLNYAAFEAAVDDEMAKMQTGAKV